MKGVTSFRDLRRSYAELAIRLVGESLSKEYGIEGEQVRCFLGPRTSVELSLTVEGGPEHLDGVVEGAGFPLVTTYCPEAPGVNSEAVSWEVPVTRMLDALWGPAVAVRAFRSENERLRRAGATVLETAPPDVEAGMLPEFTAALGDDLLRGPAATLLGRSDPRAQRPCPI